MGKGTRVRSSFAPSRLFILFRRPLAYSFAVLIVGNSINDVASSKMFLAGLVELFSELRAPWKSMQEQRNMA